MDLAQRGKRATVSTLDGSNDVIESPQSLLVQCIQTLGYDVSMDAYAIARMIRSEAGDRGPEGKNWRAHIAINDANRLGKSLLSTVTYSKDASKRDRFGDQDDQRYATTRDPYENDVVIALNVLYQRATGGEDPTGGALKFVNEDAFKAGRFDTVVANWAKEGLSPEAVPEVESDLVVFRRA